MGSFFCLGMSKEAGELKSEASQQPQRSSTGFSRAAPSLRTAPTTDVAAEDSGHGAVGDDLQTQARHRHGDAKENIGSVLNPTYNYGKVCSVTALQCCFHVMGVAASLSLLAFCFCLCTI